MNLNPVVFQFLQFTGGGKIAKVRLHLRAGSNTVVAPISLRGWGMRGAWLIYFHVFQIEGSVNVEGEGGNFHIYDKRYV